MKGAAHYHSLSAQENLVLKQAQNVNKLYSEVRRPDVNFIKTPTLVCQRNKLHGI